MALWLFPLFTQSLLCKAAILARQRTLGAGIYFFFCYKSASEGVFSVDDCVRRVEMRHKTCSELWNNRRKPYSERENARIYCRKLACNNKIEAL